MTGKLNLDPRVVAEARRLAARRLAARRPSR
jgi:hypothetical protein